MSRSARQLLRAALTGAGTVAAATVLVFAPALSASAHNQLVSTTPVANSTATAVESVTLEFNEDVLDLGDAGSASIVQVTDSAGKHFETACATTERKVVTVPVALGQAGQYTVAYSIVSADGHRVSADYSFDYQPADESAAATGTENARAIRTATARRSRSRSRNARGRPSSVDLPFSAGSTEALCSSISQNFSPSR